MKILQKALLIGFITAGGLKAQTGFVYYSTDFSSNPSTIPANQSYSANHPLPTTADPSSQDGWFSGLGGGSSDANWLASAGISSNNQLFVGGAQILDGYAPTNQVTFATRNIADMGGGKLLGNSVAFNAVFNIQGSTNGNFDNFAWTLFNANGNQLVSFDFNVTNTAGSISYNLGATSYANDSDLSSQGLIANGPAPTNPGAVLNIQTNTTYSFKFQVDNIGIAGQQSVSLWSYNSGINLPPTALATNQLLNYTDFSPSAVNNGDTNIAQIGLTWVINDTTTNPSGQFVNFGDNAINVSTFSVPEPSTWVLMGISGLIMVVAFRRKKA